MAIQGEKRSINIHPEIIFRIIDSQSGTLGKAFSEYVMNSIDASATQVKIDISSNEFVVTDNGPGFHGIEAIEGFFETLGFPHDENDHRTYGSFGIGRAQMWSFASTLWRSSHFGMDVDIKNRGLDYTLRTDLKEYNGCAIKGKFYNPLSPLEINETIKELTMLIQYVDTPILINGKQVNKKVKEEKWDIETDEAYITKKQNGGLKVYNLGVLVKEYSAWQMGLSGTVVSKKQLKLNMARNDMLVGKCEVWKKIRKSVEGAAVKDNKKKARLTDDERMHFINLIKSGELALNDARELKLITDATGRGWSIQRLQDYAWGNTPISAAPTVNSAIADKVHRSKEAFVLAKPVLDMFQVESLGKLKEELVAITHLPINAGCYCDFSRIKLIDFDEINKMYKDGYSRIPTKDLLPLEKQALFACEKIGREIAGLMRAEYGNSFKNRQICVGLSDTAEAWTNGIDYIVLNRDLLKEANNGYAGFQKITAVILHEYLHRDGDMGDHAHDMQFYTEYHDYSMAPEVLNATQKGLHEYLARLKVNDLKINKNLLGFQDMMFRYEKATEGPIENESQQGDPEIDNDDSLSVN